MSFKFYMPAGTFFVVLAGGAVIAESLLAKRKAAKPIYVSVLLLSGFLMLPIAAPVLPVEQYVEFDRAFSLLSGSIKVENLETVELPQHFADRFVWDELVEAVADVYHELPSADQERCAILASNYGAAGAIDLLGAKYGLPKSISGQLSFYVWGPREYTGELMILAGFPADAEPDLKELFEDVQVKAVVHSKYAIPHENNNPVFLCKDLKITMEEAWALVKTMG